MSARETENLIRSSTQVPEPDQSTNILLNGVAQMGQKIIADDQQAKIVNNVSQAQLDLTKMTQDYRLKNADDPFGGLSDLKSQRDEVLAGYGEQISPFFKRQWNDTARELSQKQDVQNQTWAYEQTRANTVKAINNSMQLNFQQANIDGQNYGSGSADTIDALTAFNTSKQKLVAAGHGIVGAEETQGMLKNYDKDYMKSFISGIAETSPQKAGEMLNDPGIKGRFTTQERGEFADIIAKTQRQQELVKSFQTTQTTQQVTDLINDPEQNYMNKRLAIDKLDMAGSISQETAAKARRVLTSQKDVDSITNGDKMGSLVQQMYDLNANQKINNDDYLKGVRNLHDQIFEMQANGDLNAQDVLKMNNELRTMTSKRVSDATKSVGNEMSDATDMFQQLPPEYRGEATRQLFYATTGKTDNMTDDQAATLSKNAAIKIIDNMNAQRRAAALRTKNSISTIGSDDLEFVKSIGASPDDVQETAKKYNMTPQQVIERLRKERQQ